MTEFNLSLLDSKEQTMSSLEIAELTGKEHKNVMRDIRNLMSQLENGGGSNFELSSYTSEQNKELPCYTLTKKGCLILASGYNALLREKIIDRWEELELERAQAKPVITLPTRKELAQLVVQQEEELERLALENKQKDETIHAFTDANADLAEKNAEFVSFITSLMQNNKTIPISLFAKNYGMTAQEMNVLLQKFGIIYKCGNVWLPTKQYDDSGYTITTYIPSPFTKWTRRGVAFLYKTLKEHGYLPISETK